APARHPGRERRAGVLDHAPEDQDHAHRWLGHQGRAAHVPARAREQGGPRVPEAQGLHDRGREGALRLGGRQGDAHRRRLLGGVLRPAHHVGEDPGDRPPGGGREHHDLAGSGIKVVPLMYPRVPENKEDLEFLKLKVYTTEGVKGLFVSEDDKATLIVAGFWEEYFDLPTMWAKIQEIVRQEEDANTTI